VNDPDLVPVYVAVVVSGCSLIGVIITATFA
jgi:hypothetical protein